MRITEKSAERLGIRLVRNGVSVGLCVLDRAKDATFVTRLALVIPYMRRRIPLSKIRDVTVKRPGRQQAYHPTLELGAGDTLSIGGYSKEEALEAARAIRDFLKIRDRASVHPPA